MSDDQSANAEQQYIERAKALALQTYCELVEFTIAQLHERANQALQTCSHFPAEDLTHSFFAGKHHAITELIGDLTGGLNAIHAEAEIVKAIGQIEQARGKSLPQ